jgi:endonuclease G
MKVHIRIYGTILVVLLLSAPLTPAKAQNDLEERIERLETIVDSLKALFGNRLRVIPSYETIVDTPNVQYGIASLVDWKLDKDYYFINYNGDWKVAYWVAYYLSAENLQGDANQDEDFITDDDLPEYAQSISADYDEYHGLQKGHLAPAAAFKRSTDARASTYIYSNASPQHAKFNNGIWKRLEYRIKKMVNEVGEAWIVTGNAFINSDSMFISPREWIGHMEEPRVAVPTHLFKAILSLNENGEFKTYALIIPNELQLNQNPLNDYSISIDRLEQMTGYDFFILLPDNIENDIERDNPAWRW